MSYCIVNLGCKVNRVESDRFAAVFTQLGHTAAKEADADVVLVNTCMVTGEAEKKTRKAVRHALSKNERATVIVTGCAAALDATTYEAMSDRVVVVVKAQVENHLRVHYSANGSHEIAEDGCTSALLAHLSKAGDIRTRVGVKIQDGCNNCCTYCIVHVARGKAHSMSFDTVSQQVRLLMAEGVNEVLLTGINLGTYRDDSLAVPMDFAGLLRALSKIARECERSDGTIPRVRIGSIEPREVTPSVIEAMAENHGVICSHLHMPLQAGSNKVLKEMARPYKVEKFMQTTGALYSALPNLSLSTDIIAGFPGETDAEFQETLSVARTSRFTKIHAFPYSKREGTVAAARADQVPDHVRLERAKELRACGDELRRSEFARRAGSYELCVIEPGGRAMTDSAYEIPYEGTAQVGALVRLQIPSGVEPDGLYLF